MQESTLMKGARIRALNWRVKQRSAACVRESRRIGYKNRRLLVSEVNGRAVEGCLGWRYRAGDDS